MHDEEDREVDELFGDPGIRFDGESEAEEGGAEAETEPQETRATEPGWWRSSIRYGRIVGAFLGGGFLLYLGFYPLACGPPKGVDAKIQERKEKEPPREATDADYHRNYPGLPAPSSEGSEELEAAFGRFGEGESGATEDPWRDEEETSSQPTLRERLFEKGLVAPTLISGLGNARTSASAAPGPGTGRAPAIEDAFERIGRSIGRIGDDGSGAAPRSQVAPLERSQASGVATLGLPAGTVIAARLVTEINSDLPGTVLARVDREVLAPGYERTLIPAGAVLVADYDSGLEVGQNALFVGWHTVVYPNGASWRLDDLPGHDLRGASGLRDKVHHHTWPIFGHAALLGLVSASFDVGRVETGLDTRLGSGERAGNAVVTEMERAAGKLLDRSLDRRPTVRIRRGQPFYVLVTSETQFPRWSEKTMTRTPQ